MACQPYVKGIIYLLVFVVLPFSVLTAQNASVIFNEIMYAPTTGSSEWIELINRGTSAIDIHSWSLRDAGGSTAMLPDRSVILEPGQYLVLCGDSAFREQNPLIAQSIVLLGSFPVLNNSGDDLFLIDYAGRTVDSVKYRPSWGGQSGTSLERISIRRPSSDRRNWNNCIASGSSTPGNRNSIAAPAVDLTAYGMVIHPSLPRLGETVNVRVAVMNAGDYSATDIHVELGEDRNHNGIVDDSEDIGAVSLSPLDPGDSALVGFVLTGSAASTRILIAHAWCSGDTLALNDRLIDTVTFSFPPQTIIINELQYAPSSREPEWIELFNPTEHVVNLSGWMIADSGPWKTIPHATMDPGGYVVLSSTDELAALYPDLAERLVVLPLPSLNNSGDVVRIADASGCIIDSLEYFPAWGGSEGRSLERIAPGNNSCDAGNWGTCLAAYHATPGHPNSIRALEHDLALSRMALRGAAVDVAVCNRGLQTAVGGVVDLCRDVECGGPPNTAARIGSISVPNLRPQDSITITFSDVMMPQGMSCLVATVRWSDDMRTLNDTVRIIHSLSIERRSLVVNEIVYEPHPGECEWIEIVNATDSSLQCRGLTIAGSCGSGNIRRPIAKLNQSVIVRPRGFLVVAGDSSIFTRFPELASLKDSTSLVLTGDGSLGLNNDVDDIVIIDPVGRVIDSVRYSSRWHNAVIGSSKGRSLERLNPIFGSCDPANWSTCTDVRGSTPGRRNSLYISATTIPEGGAPRLTFAPNPFSPDGDGLEDACVLSYTIPPAVAQIRLRIYDALGHLVRTLADGDPSSGNGRILFNGRDDAGQRLRVGIYIALLDAVDVVTHQTYREKGVVVVATNL